MPHLRLEFGAMVIVAWRDGDGLTTVTMDPTTGPIPFFFDHLDQEHARTLGDVFSTLATFLRRE